MSTKSLFRKAAEAKPISNYAPSFKLGRHRVALKFIRGAESEKTKEEFVEAEFLILESETDQVGASRGVAWFLNTTGWPGVYAAGRLQQFLGIARDAMGDIARNDKGEQMDLEEFGTELADEDTNPGNGVQLVVDVTQVLDKVTGLPAKGKKNNLIFDLAWSADEQSMDEIQETRKLMEELESKPPAAASRPKAEPEAAKPQVSATPKTSGMRNLLGRK